MSVSAASALTPGQYAGKLGVRGPQVLGWINSGQLRAIDVSSKPGTGRPTWRIPLDAICEFEARRSVTSPAKVVRRTREKQAADFVEYF
jgi:hypothetical protein